MKITALIGHPAIRNAPGWQNPLANRRFHMQLPSPDLKAAARTGTAFDHALRAGLRARFPCRSELSAAEAAPAALAPDERTARALTREIEEAMTRLRRAAREPELNEAGIRAAFRVADFDTWYRSGRIDALDRPVAAVNENDLWALYHAIPWESFRPKERIVLGPTVAGDHAISGDGDLLVDDRLIDVKVVSEDRFGVELIRQLGAYAAVFSTHGVAGDPSARVGSFGVYHARSAELATFEAEDALPPSAWPELYERLADVAARDRDEDEESAVLDVEGDLEAVVDAMCALDPRDEGVRFGDLRASLGWSAARLSEALIEGDEVGATLWKRASGRWFVG